MLCCRSLADIDGDGRLVPDEFIVALHYVAIAKSGKPVPASLPSDIVPPSYRKHQKAPTSESPAEKQPESLPRPTSRPPTGVTKVPAIQPPSSATAKSQSHVTAPPAVPAALTDGTDPFGMKPAVFDATAHVPAADAEKETAAVNESSAPAAAPSSDISPKETISPPVEPSSAVDNEGMYIAVKL